eukprot:695410_1
MASQLNADLEGNATQSEIEKLLVANKVIIKVDPKYAEALDALGVKSTDDFKMITTDDEFKGLMDEISNYFKSKNVDVTYMDRIKLKKAWNALVPTKPKKSQIIPMGPKERESLELLAKYMQYIQSEMVKVDECLNGSQLEMYCKQIRDQSNLLQQSIQKREKELIQDVTTKFNGIEKEYKTKQKQLESLALRMNGIKNKCDEALNMNEYDQLQERRNTICKTLESAKESMEEAMAHNVEASMKTIQLELSDGKAINDKILKFGHVSVQLPFDIAIKTVTMNGDSFNVVWDITNGAYLHKQCDNLMVSVIKQNDDEKVNADAKENVLASKRIQGDLSTISNAELEVDRNELQKNCILVFQINVFNKTVQKRYKCELPDRVKFLGYVKWNQATGLNCTEEDNAMNKACNDKFKGSRAATDSEIIQGKVDGLQKWQEMRLIFAHSGGGDLWRANAYKNGNRQFGRHCWYNQWPFNANDYANSGGWYGNTNAQTIAVTCIDDVCLNEM